MGDHTGIPGAVVFAIFYKRTATIILLWNGRQALSICATVAPHDRYDSTLYKLKSNRQKLIWYADVALFAFYPWLTALILPIDTAY